MDFHERVRQGYLALAEEEPQRIACINAEQRPEDVLMQSLSAVEDYLGHSGLSLRP